MVEKIFMADDNVAVFICPACKQAKRVDVSKYQNIEKASRIKCKCPCGHTYTVILEKRKFYRKTTRLPGVYVNFIPSFGNNFCEEIGRGALVITDLSRTGMQFSLNMEQNFKPEDKLMIEFYLDDQQKTLVKKSVFVKNINGLEIGAEFCIVDPSDPNDRAIGFYLMR